MKHYATKLKEQNAQLLADIYAIIDGDIELLTRYEIARNLKKYVEKAIWCGEGKIEINKLDGLINFKSKKP